MNEVHSCGADVSSHARLMQGMKNHAFLHFECFDQSGILRFTIISCNRTMGAIGCIFFFYSILSFVDGRFILATFIWGRNPIFLQPKS